MKKSGSDKSGVYVPQTTNEEKNRRFKDEYGYGKDSQKSPRDELFATARYEREDMTNGPGKDWYSSQHKALVIGTPHSFHGAKPATRVKLSGNPSAHQIGKRSK